MSQEPSNTFLNQNQKGIYQLTPKGASHLATLALKCIHQEYPNKPGHTLSDAEDIRSPRSLHPAFYGCYDWHSSVHGHWMLIRLLKSFPDLPEASTIRAALDQNLSADHILQEKTYFERPESRSFERTYGWAWLLKLAEELHTWDDPQGKIWAGNLRPLSDLIVTRYLTFLPKQSYPIRTGVHPNTAFGIAFALDYAQTVKDDKLEKLLISRSREYYEKDQNCPVDWEPGGNDFFSPCLLEADLMRRVLDTQNFETWLSAFLPEKQLKEYETVAEVSDRSDPQIVHLDGLNLSRAWAMLGVSQSLAETHPLQERLRALAQAHIEATLPHIASGDYAGEHWLASFAVYVLSF